MSIQKSLAPKMLVTLQAPRVPTASSSCSSCALRKRCIPRGFNEKELLQFETIATCKRRVSRNASLFRRHDKMSTLYVVRYGQFKRTGGELDEQHVAGFHTAGDLLGLDAIASGVHSFRLTALEDSEVCEIPFDAITEMMKASPMLQRQILQILSEALNDDYRRSSLLARTSVDERFAGFLLTLGEKYSRIGYSSRSYRLNMSRADIGSYLGTSNESISRVIARFNAHGAASIEGRTVELHDQAFLRALACGDEQAVKVKDLPRATNGVAH